jgi:hypothetical protein
MPEIAPDGLPIYELDDPEAPYGLSAMGGGYVIVRPETTFSIVDLIADDGRDWGVSDNGDVIASFRDRSDAEMFIAAKSYPLTAP